jgi:hypothetical protein
VKYALMTTVLLGLLLVLALEGVGPGNVPANPAPSAVQVTLDGVPVCVFRHAGQLLASVGRCGEEVEVPPPEPAVPDEPSRGNRLPPGHPPIGPDGGGLEEPERTISI